MIRGELRVVFQWCVPENTTEEDKEGLREEAECRLTSYAAQIETISNLLNIEYSQIEIEADFE